MTAVSVRMEDSLKQFFESAREGMGMSMATCFTIFAKRVARDRKIPFEITAPSDPFYSESNLMALEESEKQLRQGRVVTKTMEELEAIANGQNSHYD